MSQQSKYKLGHIYKWRNSCLFVPFVMPSDKPLVFAVDLYTGQVEPLSIDRSKDIGDFDDDGRVLITGPSGGNFSSIDDSSNDWGVVIQDSDSFNRGHCYHNWGHIGKNVEIVGALLL